MKQILPFIRYRCSFARIAVLHVSNIRSFIYNEMKKQIYPKTPLNHLLGLFFMCLCILCSIKQDVGFKRGLFVFIYKAIRLHKSNGHWSAGQMHVVSDTDVTPTDRWLNV